MWTVIAFAVIIYVILWLIVLKYRKPYENIPGVSQLMPDFGKMIPYINPYTLKKIVGHGCHNSAYQLMRKLKTNVMRVTTWTQTQIFISDAEVLKEIFLKNPENFPKPQQSYKPLLLYGDNIVNSNFDVWRKHRNICQPAFHENHMRFLAEQTVISTNTLLNFWGKRGDAFDIDVETDLTNITLDVIGKVNFGYNLNVFGEDTFDASKHKMSFKNALITTVNLGLLVKGILPEWTHFAFPTVVTAYEETKSYIKDLIDSRLNSSEQKYDLLSLLIEGNIRNGELSNEDVLADSFIFLFAGHETSATTLMWCLYELAIKQRVQQKLFDEVDSILKNKDPVYEDYEKLLYLNSVVNETLRLHSAVAMIPKENLKPFKIGKHYVPAKTTLLVNVFAVHNDEKYWPNPSEFRPERFLDGTKIAPCTYLPFSFGLRKCKNATCRRQLILLGIGNKFSLVETCMILAMIVQKYEIHISKQETRVFSDEKPIDNYVVVTVKPKDLKIELRRRK
ncbi:cytochrome P450 [Acrasis kona]|uniref:Cytochrome P450 n=1 Tax=Acrasis kona TaxID=1008807 RepID=A0AAW2ZLT1_9EUKA